MNEQEKRAREEELKAQIAELQIELQEIKRPTSIAKLINTPMFMVLPDNKTREPVLIVDRMPGNITGWDYLRKFCQQLFYGKYGFNSKKYHIKDLTEDEIRLCADLANELIPIWNKYMLRVYGG